MNSNGSMSDKRRRGEDHPSAVLTTEQVLTARDLSNARIENVAEMARWFGVSETTMWYAVHGDQVDHYSARGVQRGTWKHLPNSSAYTGHDWFGTRANSQAEENYVEDRYWKKQFPDGTP